MTTPRPVRPTWALAAAAMLLAQGPAFAQTISSLGALPGGSETQGLSVSANGREVAGNCDPFGPGPARAFRWTKSGGPADIGSLPGSSDDWGLAISGNGQAVAGISFGERSEVAYRWTRARGMQSLGTLPGAAYGSEAYGLSFTGDAVCGVSDSAAGQWHAFRWTERGGMQDLGVFDEGGSSFAYGISADGRCVTGIVDGPDFSYEAAFLWTAQRGMVRLPAANPGDPCGGLAISADGTAVAGYSGFSAAMWDRRGAHDLGLLEDGTFSFAYSISGDGSVVGGVADDPEHPYSTAAIWTERTGLIALDAWLESRGVDLSHWSLDVVAGISADGSTLVGVGSLDGVMSGWIVNLPPHAFDRCGDGDGDGHRGDDRNRHHRR